MPHGRPRVASMRRRREAGQLLEERIPVHSPVRMESSKFGPEVKSQPRKLVALRESLRVGWRVGEIDRCSGRKRCLDRRLKIETCQVADGTPSIGVRVLSRHRYPSLVRLHTRADTQLPPFRAASRARIHLNHHGRFHLQVVALLTARKIVPVLRILLVLAIARECHGALSYSSHGAQCRRGKLKRGHPASTHGNRQYSRADRERKTRQRKSRAKPALSRIVERRYGHHVRHSPDTSNSTSSFLEFR